MKECERIVAAWGCPAIYLKVQAKNPAGVALYERLGYHQARPADDKVSLLLLM
jgi:ribosomal protein S18 acetylase RimI-like enzyme